MSSESPYSYTVKDHKGNLYTMRGDNITAFRQNVEDGLEFLAELNNGGGIIPPLVAVPTPEQAVATVQQVFPGATHVVPQPTVPVPHLSPAQPQQQAAPAGKKWIPAGVSKRTGKPYEGFWAAL